MRHLEKVGDRDVSLAPTATLQEVLGKYYRDDPTTLENMGVLGRLR